MMENNIYYYNICYKHSIVVYTTKYNNCLKKDRKFLCIDLEIEKNKGTRNIKINKKHN